MTTIKTYFLIDSETCEYVTENIANGKTKYEFNFPIEFYAAKGDKWVELRYCYALFDKYLMSDIVLHSDLIKRDNYLDSSISVINVLNNGAKPDKYLIPPGSSKHFSVWFTDLKGQNMKPDCFQIKMLLIYNV